jgi:hypothetical protein
MVEMWYGDSPSILLENDDEPLRSTPDLQSDFGEWRLGRLFATKAFCFWMI